MDISNLKIADNVYIIKDKTARETANNADVKADKAITDSSQAKTNASNAQTSANNAQTSADNANTKIDNSKLTGEYTDTTETLELKLEIGNI